MVRNRLVFADSHIFMMFLIMLLRVVYLYSKQLSSKNIYMTCEAMRLKNTKYKLWRKYCTTHVQTDHDIDAFVSARNKLQSLTSYRSLRQDFEQSITENVKHNPKVFWQYASLGLKPMLLIMLFRTVTVTCCSLIQPRHQLLTSTFLVYLLMN